MFLNSDDGKIVFSILRSKENLISDLLSQWKTIPFSINLLEEQFSKMEETISNLGKLIFIKRIKYEDFFPQMKVVKLLNEMFQKKLKKFFLKDTTLF